MLVRPLFRVVAGVIFVMCIGAIILSIINVTTMWIHNVISSWSFFIWCIFGTCQFILLWGASIALIIAVSGNPPKYLKTIRGRNTGDNIKGYHTS
ncbi:MAG TPA: hypothetical protein VEF33_14970 [Syntrophales bacterium]|nr:hypothetical protein [Syntrophales bacterium]